jgi:hypothetical protein
VVRVQGGPVEGLELLWSSVEPTWSFHKLHQPQELERAGSELPRCQKGSYERDGRVRGVIKIHWESWEGLLILLGKARAKAWNQATQTLLLEATTHSTKTRGCSLGPYI